MILTRTKLPFAGQNTEHLMYSCVKSKTLTNICTEEDFFGTNVHFCYLSDYTFWPNQMM